MTQQNEEPAELRYQNIKSTIAKGVCIRVNLANEKKFGTPYCYYSFLLSDFNKDTKKWEPRAKPYLNVTEILILPALIYRAVGAGDWLVEQWYKRHPKGQVQEQPQAQAVEVIPPPFAMEEIPF